MLGLPSHRLGGQNRGEHPPPPFQLHGVAERDTLNPPSDNSAGGTLN